MFNLFPKPLEMPKQRPNYMYEMNPVQTIIQIQDSIIVVPNVEVFEKTKNGLTVHYKSGYTQELKDVNIEKIWEILSRK